MGLFDSPWGGYRGRRRSRKAGLLLREGPVLKHRAKKILRLLLLYAATHTGASFASIPASDIADRRLLKVQSMLILLSQELKLTGYKCDSHVRLVMILCHLHFKSCSRYK